MPYAENENRKEPSDSPKTAFSDRSGINFKCPHCAGALRYSIADHKMRCDRCESLVDVHALADPTAPDQDGDTAEMETVEYRCPSCGSSLYTTQTGITSFCSFCGSDVVLTERVSRIRRPDRIVPFAVSREKAAEIYRERLRQSPFVPEEMRAEAAVSRFRPVYVPFWCFSGKGDGRFTQVYSYDTTEDDYIRTDTYQEDRMGSISVSGIYYDASSQFDDETAQQLQFRDDRAVPFHPAYLSGFYAEAADVDSSLFQNPARSYASACLQGSSQSVPKNFKEEAKLVLMPVWLLPSRQGEKVVNIAIKGSSDPYRICCDLPVSPKRFLTAAGVLAVLVTALALFLRHFILLRPQITAGLSCVLAAFCWNAAAPFLEKVNLHKEDNDPTRKMLRGDGNYDLRRFLQSPLGEEESDSRYAFPMKTLGLSSLALFGVFFLIYIGSSNRLRTVNSLISDDAVFPAVLAALSGILMGVILAKHSRMGTGNRLAFILQIGLCGLIVAMKASGASIVMYYAAGLAGMIITLLVMLNAFREHNQYVLRPAPFFDRKEEGK